MGNLPCPLCSLTPDHVVERLGPGVAVWTNEQPKGSAMVIPVEHRIAPRELSPGEWMATQELMRSMMDRVDRMHRPQGWNIGWNVGEVAGQSVPHVHCHLIPRYQQELYAGRGLRWWFKQSINNRPR